MPRRVTEQDVFEAADALLARGERPTIDRVRQELGGGSPNTINPHLDVWWKALGRRIGGVQAPGLPPAFLQSCARFFDEIRGLAMKEAQGALAEQQRFAQNARLALEVGQAAMATERTGLEATIGTLRGELARLNEANQVLSLQVAQQQVDVVNAREQANQSIQELKNAQEARGRASAAAQAEIDRVREQWQGNETRWLGEIDHLREEAKRQRGEQDRAQKGFQARIQVLEQQLSDGAKERATLRMAVDTVQRDLANEREKRSFAEGALAASRKRGREAPATALRRRRAREPA